MVRRSSDPGKAGGMTLKLALEHQNFQSEKY